MGPEFGFPLPHLPKRNWVCAVEYRSPVTAARVRDGRWEGDLYTNGIAEDDNPTPIVDMHLAVVGALVARLGEAGWR